jgi:hypothetical protein
LSCRAVWSDGWHGKLVMHWSLLRGLCVPGRINLCHCLSVLSRQVLGSWRSSVHQLLCGAVRFGICTRERNVLGTLRSRTIRLAIGSDYVVL